MSSEQPTHPWYSQTWLAVVALVLFFPLGLFLMWRFTRWQTWLKTSITVILSLLTILFIIGEVAGEEDGSGETVRQETSPSPTVETHASTPEPTPTPEPPPAETVTYEIAAREDVSVWPTVRIVYRVSVSGPLTEDDIRRIAQEIIDDETSQQDVNAIAFSFYLPGSDTTDIYSAGKAIWAPDGDLASADTVRAGDYSRHKLGAIDVGGALGEPFTPSAETLAISEDDRRAIFKELMAAEYRADAEAEAIYPLDIFDPNWQEDNVEKNVDLYWELFEKYNAEVRAKYGITEDHADEIAAEGVTQYWPSE